MKCLRCGYCCKNMMVIIVDNPEKGISEDNLIAHMGKNQSCQHLEGNTPGEYSCAIHDKIWYKQTPCFTHGQIESSINNICRMGEYLFKNMKHKNEMKQNEN